MPFAALAGLYVIALTSSMFLSYNDGEKGKSWEQKMRPAAFYATLVSVGSALLIIVHVLDWTSEQFVINAVIWLCALAFASVVPSKAHKAGLADYRKRV